MNIHVSPSLQIIIYNAYDNEEFGANIRTRVSEPNFCVDSFPIHVSEL